MTEETLDVSICVRCLLSDDWRKRLVTADPAVQTLVCATFRHEFLKTGRAPQGRCLAGRGNGLFHWSDPDPETGKRHMIHHEGSWVYPWSGSVAVNTIWDLAKSYNDRGRCSDFLDMSEVVIEEEEL